MGLFFSKPSYNPKRDIPDLNGKVAVVTGANTGIGYHTAEQLAIHGAKVYLACRTESKALAAISRMEKDTPTLKGADRVIWLPLDLSSIHSAKKAAEEILAKETRLDILVNNAGRLAEDYVLSEDGIEQTVAVNHIGHFVLTTTLLPLLKATARLPGADVRIVIVSSIAYKTPGQTKFDSLEDFNAVQGKSGKENIWLTKYWRYCSSKLMNLLFTAELQRRFDEEDVPINVITLHPGSGAQSSSPFMIRILLWFVAITPLEGAYTSLFAATSAEVAAAPDKYKGKYLESYGKTVKLTTKESQDPVLAKRLWNTTEKVVADVLAK
ncbi:hypothetical protein EW146_g1098 [Bondarzewia mesenterica]|uniref:Uncharacterized protein n=1 Tax=Bondarzewia mesenterica TaxID=1095465 RepID=A0A4S4M509_9AGAM|nr:hypothetical protein EW146_g1098 [Bondarzewia mesenterica]